LPFPQQLIADDFARQQCHDNWCFSAFLGLIELSIEGLVAAGCLGAKKSFKRTTIPLGFGRAQAIGRTFQIGASVEITVKMAQVLIE
jgi:hypothetical protein